MSDLPSRSGGDLEDGLMTDSSNEHMASAEISCHGERSIPAANKIITIFNRFDNQRLRELARVLLSYGTKFGKIVCSAFDPNIYANIKLCYYL